MTTSIDASAGSDLRARLVELAAERDALRAQLEGDLPTATRWLQRKVWRQAQALDALNRRVVAQRFVLRTLDGPTHGCGTGSARLATDGGGGRQAPPPTTNRPSPRALGPLWPCALCPCATMIRPSARELAERPLPQVLHGRSSRL